ncbi:MAG: HAMP domain-containing protein [Anaerolineales bacterium]|nr:HAMP domain-containing protein [Anaerolineales bacterium]
MVEPNTPNPSDKSHRIPLRRKITLPYAFLAIVAGAVAAYLMTTVIVSRLEERFHNQLLEAGGQVADSVVRQEQKNLETWRLIAFTEGLPQAVRMMNEAALANIAGLAALNACQDLVDVLDVEGAPLFAAHRSPGSTCQDYTFTPWQDDYNGINLVQTIAAGTVDGRGDKFAGLVFMDGNWLLYTAGPIYASEGGRVGTLLVGTYLENLVRQLKSDALADVTVYGPDGRPLTSTFPETERADLALTPDLYRQVVERQDESILTSEFIKAGDEYIQALGLFEVRGGDDLGVIGAALPMQWIFSSAYPARNWLMAVFAVAIIAILLTGNLLASRIVKPVYQLVNASQQVAQGNLNQQVNIETGDEIGTLAVFFNRMVDGLRDRERVKDLFGRYVGDEVAQEILKGNIKIGGRRVEATVLFSDIRDFTSISEKSEPDMLVRSLQEYFTAMISEVEIQKGLINKFGGDSILALFGAPVYIPDHAQLAVHAALRMIDRLEEINTSRAERGEPALRVGIGVNSGPMVVGNMGTQERAEFTAIGDAVNVASRLSEMNKDGIDASIFISQSTMKKLDWMAESLELKDLGEILVKGKSEKVKVYAIVGWG